MQISVLEPRGNARNRQPEDLGATAEPFRRGRWLSVAIILLVGLVGGCTPWGEYVRNGFKVGPNYGRPAAPVARDWIDANDVHVRHDEQEQTRWWSVLHDPALDALICTAYRQNLTLRAAGFRILEARAQLGIDTGNLFPQTQDAAGAYRHSEGSLENGPGGGGGGGGSRFSNNVNFGFNMAWELDFWGRFRRAIESDSASLDASVELYDAAMLTLLGDIATNYVQMRTTEQRIKYAVENVRIQSDTFEIVGSKFKIGAPKTTELEYSQARSTLFSTEAAIPELEISLRQTTNQLCILLGFRRRNCEPALGRARSRPRQPRWWSASRPICSVAGRTCVPPSGNWQRSVP
jgi:outer membrane protein TolC